MSLVSFKGAVGLAVLVAAVGGCRTPPEEVRIHQVQGSGQVSPLAGMEVRGVRGVVTAIDAEGGFWVQDPKGDGDDATSEGLFVAADAALEPGQSVEVDGRIEEYADPERTADLTVTRLRASAVRVTGHGATLPAPVRLGRGGRLPPSTGTHAVDFYERLEGMRVEIVDAVVVGPTTRHGELVVVADGGVDASPRTRRGGLRLTPEDANPERLHVAGRLGDGVPQVDVGDVFQGAITGVVDYSFGNFKIVPTAPLPPVARAAPADEATALRPGERRLTVATFNVYNLSASDEPEKFRRLAATLVSDLGAPDVVALQEIQDDDGAADSGRAGAAGTYKALIAAAEAAGGPCYDYRQVDPVDGADGGEPGGNIRVGLLFNPARVAFVDRGAAGPLDAVRVEAGPDGPRLSLSPGRVAPREAAFDDSRKPLAGELVFRGQRFFVIANHLTSKGGDDPLMGARQPPRRPTEALRLRQAELLHGFMESFLAVDPHARVIVLGDMNEMEFRPPMAALAGQRWVNLIEKLPPEDRYTYVYEGNSQVLDHVLVSPALAAGAAPEVDVVHVYAERAHEGRASDHDPVVARLTFE
jgi:hypothetical protein